MDYFVIYKKPRDYPKNFVVRQYRIDDIGVQASFPNLFTTLKKARASIPQGFTCFPRHKTDDKVIVETWI